MRLTLSSGRFARTSQLSPEPWPVLVPPWNVQPFLEAHVQRDIHTVEVVLPVTQVVLRRVLDE